MLVGIVVVEGVMDNCIVRQFESGLRTRRQGLIRSFFLIEKVVVEVAAARLIGIGWYGAILELFVCQRVVLYYISLIILWIL